MRVATPRIRPAAGWATVYAFLPRTVVPKPEERVAPLSNHGSSAATRATLSIRNDVLNAWLMSVVLWAALLVVFGIGFCRTCCSRPPSESCCSRS